MTRALLLQLLGALLVFNVGVVAGAWWHATSARRAAQHRPFGVIPDTYAQSRQTRRRFSRGFARGVMDHDRRLRGRDN